MTKRKWLALVCMLPMFLGGIGALVGVIMMRDKFPLAALYFFAGGVILLALFKVGIALWDSEWGKK